MWSPLNVMLVATSIYRNIFRETERFGPILSPELSKILSKMGHAAPRLVRWGFGTASGQGCRCVEPTFNTHHSALNTQHSALNTQHLTLAWSGGVSGPLRARAAGVWSPLRFSSKTRRFDPKEKMDLGKDVNFWMD